MQIRPARLEDAVEACEILRRSITELCRADHQDDSRNLEAWLSNKTADNVRSWIADPNTHSVVAIEGTAIIGVGAVTSSGEIVLNYVSPAARFRGVSKAVLRWLEAKALELGNAHCAVTSTETARRFYLSAGYAQQGSPTVSFGKITGYPMVKQLSNARQVRSALSDDELVRSALTGKLNAISGYDAILWKIRAGYAAILYGSLALMIGSQGVPSPKERTLQWSLSILFLIIGFTVAAFFVDLAYLKKKLKVIAMRNSLTSLISRSLKDGSTPSLVSLEYHLHIAGEADIRKKGFFSDELVEEYRRQLIWNLKSIHLPLYSAAFFVALAVLVTALLTD